MASRRLTKVLKDEIKKNIETQVKKTMEKSIPGKELQETKNTLVAFLRDYVSNAVSEDEMAILKKYNHTNTCCRCFVVMIQWGKSKPSLKSSWSSGMELLFDPVIIGPNIWDFSYDGLLRTVEENPEMCALALTGIKIDQHIKCEIKETTNAFMEIVNSYTTTAKLREANPDMEKYIPTWTRVSNTNIVSKRARSIIKNFQET